MSHRKQFGEAHAFTQSGVSRVTRAGEPSSSPFLFSASYSIHPSLPVPRLQIPVGYISHTTTIMSSQDTPAHVDPEVNGDDEKERSRIVRLRENKRRSRARQKEYVQQLERRCREYEQAHVQATVEMQVAARKVAGDNKMLRLLLRKMGADDHMIDSWLEGQMGSEDGRTLNLPIRKRSQSVSTAAGGDSQFGDGSPGPQFLGEHTPKLEHHYIDTSAPNSPQGRNLPLLLQPLTQPTSPVLRGPSISHFHDEHGLQPFAYSPVLGFNNISSPTHSTVASSPQAILESPNLQYYPVHPPSPSAAFTPIPQQIDPANSLERKPPLVFIRLDPTNDLYKLYPMSTIAIIPWLYSSVAPQHEVDIQHHINNPNVVGIECEAPKADHDAFSGFAQPNYDFNFEYSTATSEEGDRSNVEMDSESGSGPSVWT
ncbi:hypothetical protein DFH27DRAFT_604995 [Peziza echinospora]|nr:hypothetical protein DFH27DRAFT_604995 [Peziza echinospora]